MSATVEAVTVACAWCDTVLADAGPDAPVSHGICAECAADVLDGEADA